jgi:hypothetical protein
LLILFDGKKIVDTLNLTTPYPVSVDKTATGIQVYTGFEANPHPVGTALKMVAAS